MAVHLLTPVAPSVAVPRAHPCEASIDALAGECGATPALMFRRVCLHRHARDLYLCATHEKAVPSTGQCRDCAGLPSGAHACPVGLVVVAEALDLIRTGVR